MNGFTTNYYYTPQYNSYFGCNDPYSSLSASCSPYPAFGRTFYGAYPFAGAGYLGDSRYVPKIGDDRPGDEQGDSGSQERTAVIPNPPRADALDAASSQGIDPRDAVLILDGEAQTSTANGTELTIGSGQHTLRVTAKPGAAPEDSHPPPVPANKESH